MSLSTVNTSADPSVKPKTKVQVLPLTMERRTEDSRPPPRVESADQKVCSTQIKGKFFSKLTCGSNRSLAEKIDIACRILFPLTYALYNTGYWFVYLNGIEILA